MSHSSSDLHCRCGRLHLRTEGKPIISTECCCTSCRTAGRELEELPGAPPLLGPHGTTGFVLYRKDRVDFVAGADALREHRLTSKSPTRRVVATCCNTPVFLEFQGGHWLSLYAGLWPADALPPLEMRTMASDLPDPAVLPDDVPNARTQGGKFMFKLLAAWVAMGFRVPRVAVAGQLQR